MLNQPTNLGAITERRIERVLTREDCMVMALQQIIMKCDGSEMQTKRIRNIRERAKAGLDGRDPSSPGELGHVPPNHLLMAQLELSGKETDAARAERDALAAELKALREQVPFDAGEARFRDAFDAAIRRGNWPSARNGYGYRSPMTQMAWQASFCTVNRLGLYARPVPARELTSNVIDRLFADASFQENEMREAADYFAHEIERYLKGESE